MRAKSLVLVSILALLLSAPATAQQSIAPPPTPAPRPDADGLIWEVRPPLGDLTSFQISDYRMVVQLRCRVANGALVACAQVVDTPTAFLEAASRAASAARLAPLDQGGQPTDGREIVVRITFPIPVAIDPSPAPPTAIILTSANVEWLERPDSARISLLYPVQAFRQGLSGQAILDCIVDAEGRLACLILSEEPAGQGFGEAAIRASRLFRMAPETRDGRRTAGGRVRIPIRFDFTPPSAPSEPPN